MDMVKKAELMLSFLQTKTRDNGESFVCCTDNAPEWVIESIRTIHDDRLPDDYRYLFIQDALEAIIESGGDDDLSTELMENGADVYNYGLLKWLASSSHRVDYVDESIKDLGKCDSLMDDIRLGQCNERNEVLWALKRELENIEMVA